MHCINFNFFFFFSESSKCHASSDPINSLQESKPQQSADTRSADVMSAVDSIKSETEVKDENDSANFPLSKKPRQDLEMKQEV